MMRARMRLRQGVSCSGILSLLLAGMAVAQEPRFEVSSVRPSNPNSRDGMRIEVGSGRVTIANAPLHMVIAEAYGFSNSQMAGIGIGKLMLTLVDVQAIAATNAPPNELRQMLRALLQDRFRMQSHFEQRTVRGIQVTVDRSGSKLNAATPNETPEEPHFTADEFRGVNASLAEIVTALTKRVYTSVEDRTEIEGRYTFSVKFNGGVPRQREGLLDAVSKQLGLRFAERNVTAQVLVIDRIDMPTEN